uniref:Farnesoic acid O-methyl transferase domain-containing protein n=1 Tax=Timema genevievae TaxID=629358 RepID=A0A7R9PQY0_TIMGE|nr:unnamed protein product [Timema genevievae]
MIVYLLGPCGEIMIVYLLGPCGETMIVYLLGPCGETMIVYLLGPLRALFLSLWEEDIQHGRRYIPSCLLSASAFHQSGEFSTEDKLEYQFHPVSAGSLHFKVRTANDAHVALTTGPAESDPMYEIFIGGWGNAKTAIRRNRQKPDKALVDTPNILDAGEYRGFWIRWSGGSIAIGREGESAPFASWDDPEPFGIGYFGICTGWGATGSWLVENGAPITTADNLEYSFRPVPTGRLEVEVRSPSNAHVALTSAPNETEPMYEILLGGWENSATVIRYNREKPDKVRAETPGLLTSSEFKHFTFEWRHGLIQVKKAGGAVLVEWKDPNPFGVSYYGIRTAWGSKGHWRIKAVDPRSAPVASAPTPFVPSPVSQPGWNVPASVAPSGGSATWVDAAGGEVPPNSVPGGFDNEQVYVARARHEGALLPGKLVPSHGVCYVPWGGAEHGKPEYQVLVGCEPAWVPSVAGQVPDGALPSGETEDGEPLFVGRTKHEGTLSVGKVQASHAVCYIPYGGQEIGYQEYEVLVAK